MPKPPIPNIKMQKGTQHSTTLTTSRHPVFLFGMLTEQASPKLMPEDENSLVAEYPVVGTATGAATSGIVTAAVAVGRSDRSLHAYTVGSAMN